MEKKFSFFRFSNNNPERRGRWINACKQVNKDGSPWNPTSKNVYLCGEHFISKRPSKIQSTQISSQQYLCTTTVIIYKALQSPKDTNLPEKELDYHCHLFHLLIQNLVGYRMKLMKHLPVLIFRKTHNSLLIIQLFSNTSILSHKIHSKCSHSYRMCYWTSQKKI